jgi:hypothetical protein
MTWSNPPVVSEQGGRLKVQTQSRDDEQLTLEGKDMVPSFLLLRYNEEPAALVLQYLGKLGLR